MKNTLPSGRVLQRYRRTAEAYHNTYSIIYNDSTFSQKWQEMIKAHDFLEKYRCNLAIIEEAKHYFHTEEELRALAQWLKNSL